MNQEIDHNYELVNLTLGHSLEHWFDDVDIDHLSTDAYDAMISNRPYRKGLTVGEAIEEIRVHSGTQFDHDLASRFLSFLKQEHS